MNLAAAALTLLAVAPLGVHAAGEGATLYQTYCSSCHGARGQGTRDAPSLHGISAAYVHLMLDTGRMPAPAPNVSEIPSVPLFTYAQMDVLTRYVVGLSPHPADTSLPLVTGGNIVHGRTLFAENCAQCHGAAGDGASVGSLDVAPDLAAATVFQIGEAVRAGPGVMPRFGRDVLSDRDVDDIAYYVNYIETHAGQRDGSNAGGFPLAHIGPLAEGLVAWLFGIGALVLFIRGIGTAGENY
ncbi:MAG: c-type cytochrome [Candidatus Eremiobacteraeota bacterium]|nr:c-type cytochrome [Candidatus Eremiobacteraeota bacterium]